MYHEIACFNKAATATTSSLTSSVAAKGLRADDELSHTDQVTEAKGTPAGRPLALTLTELNPSSRSHWPESLSGTQSHVAPERRTLSPTEMCGGSGRTWAPVSPWTAALCSPGIRRRSRATSRCAGWKTASRPTTTHTCRTTPHGDTSTATGWFCSDRGDLRLIRFSLCATGLQPLISCGWTASWWSAWRSRRILGSTAAQSETLRLTSAYTLRVGQLSIVWVFGWYSMCLEDLSWSCPQSYVVTPNKSCCQHNFYHIIHLVEPVKSSWFFPWFSISAAKYVIYLCYLSICYYVRY